MEPCLPGPTPVDFWGPEEREEGQRVHLVWKGGVGALRGTGSRRATVGSLSQASRRNKRSSLGPQLRRRLERGGSSTSTKSKTGAYLLSISPISVCDLLCSASLRDICPPFKVAEDPGLAGWRLIDSRPQMQNAVRSIYLGPSHARSTHLHPNAPPPHTPYTTPCCCRGPCRTLYVPSARCVLCPWPLERRRR